MKLLKTPESRILFIALVSVLIFWYVSPDSGVRKELNQLKLEIKKSKRRTDSLSTLYIGAMRRINKIQMRRKQDSLVTAIAISDRNKARKETQKANEKYNKIKFVDLGSDSARLRAITELYPSINY